MAKIAAGILGQIISEDGRVELEQPLGRATD